MNEMESETSKEAEAFEESKSNFLLFPSRLLTCPKHTKNIEYEKSKQ